MIARSDLDSDFQVWVPLASPKMLSVVGNDTEVIPCVWLELASGGCKRSIRSVADTYLVDVLTLTQLLRFLSMHAGVELLRVREALDAKFLIWVDVFGFA